MLTLFSVLLSLPKLAEQTCQLLGLQFSSVQSLHRVQLFATPWTAATRLPCPSPTPGVNSNMSIESVMPSNHLILCRPLLLLPLIFPSVRVFCNESVLCIRWPKYWSFNFSISPSNEYSGLISFRMDWLDLCAVQGTLKSLLQYPSSKASVLWCSVFFTVQLSHPYMTTGKIIALTRWTSVGKIMSLLFNTLSRLVLTFLLVLGTTLFYKLCWPGSPKLDVFPGSSSRQGAMITLLMMQVEDFFFFTLPCNMQDFSTPTGSWTHAPMH